MVPRKKRIWQFTKLFPDLLLKENTPLKSIILKYFFVVTANLLDVNFVIEQSVSKQTEILTHCICRKQDICANISVANL